MMVDDVIMMVIMMVIMITEPCIDIQTYFISSQLIAFNRLKARQGYANGKMCSNFRPTQRRNYREVLLFY